MRVVRLALLHCMLITAQKQILYHEPSYCLRLCLITYSFSDVPYCRCLHRYQLSCAALYVNRSTLISDERTEINVRVAIAAYVTCFHFG